MHWRWVLGLTQSRHFRLLRHKIRTPLFPPCVSLHFCLPVESSPRPGSQTATTSKTPSPRSEYSSNVRSVNHPRDRRLAWGRRRRGTLRVLVVPRRLRPRLGDRVGILVSERREVDEEDYVLQILTRYPDHN
ncbi:hypothetical protein BKA70DRAFT_1558734 [Coprinopsis sp. MPI-PUGE-AT-0042]|nr:hypothetical protein BKA70DRAFT_1558734 [Coprinopsis sp. MPI-PUGE-AT-0042]